MAEVVSKTPGISDEEVKAILKECYGIVEINGNIKEFPSYDDRNYFFKVTKIENNPHIPEIWSEGYILKLTNSLESKNLDALESQNSMMSHLAKSGLLVSEPFKDKKGNVINTKILSDDELHAVRLIKFIPGITLINALPWTTDLFYQVGSITAQVDNSLETFHHPSFDTKDSLWFLSNIPKLSEFTPHLKDAKNKKLAEDIVNEFESTVIPLMDSLKKGIIHGDLNEQNIICQKDGDEIKVTSVIDFGDSQKNPFVFEIAIASMYMMTKCKTIHPNLAVGHVLAGYLQNRQLDENEWKVLKICIASRYAQSLTMSNYYYMQNPTNDYLLSSVGGGWEILSDFWNTPQKELYDSWSKIFDSYNK